MILAIVALLLALAIGGAVALFVARDPGYLLVAYDGASLETSVWFALLCAIALALALYCVSFVLRRLLRAGAGVVVWTGDRRATRARAKGQRGAARLAEGRWREAIDDLLASADSGGTPLANYLGAARAANLLASYNERDDILERAATALPDASLAVELTHAELQQAAGQWRQSMRTLTALRDRAPRHATVLKGLLAAHRALDDAEAAARLAPELPSGEALEEVHLDAWRARLVKSRGSAQAVAHARNTWRAMPRKLRDSEPLVLTYVDVLADHDADAAAEAVLRRALKRRWCASWVLRYGTLGGAAGKRRANAREWLRDHAGDASLLLTLGRIARADGDAAAAREHLLASLEVDAAPATLAEMGRLCAAEGDHQAAASYFEQALEASGDSPTDLSWSGRSPRWFSSP